VYINTRESAGIVVTVSLLVLLCLPVGCDKSETGNHAAYLGWRGSVETDLRFAEFFDDEHTLMVRFMLNYDRPYTGPILSNSGSAVGLYYPYVVGIGEYRDGPGARAKKLVVMTGGEKALYTLGEELTVGEWHHLAVVRSKEASWPYRLYFNGRLLASDGDAVAIDADFDPGPVFGVLRLGRAADEMYVDKSYNLVQTYGGRGTYMPQFYGLVDDVAVFNRALSQQEIDDLRISDRLTGVEDRLLAGYTFDSYRPDGGTLPPVLSKEYEFRTEVPGVVSAGRVKVSETRLAADHDRIPLASHPVEVRLPFAPGVAYELIQGYGGAVSHNGKACFALDAALRLKPDSTVWIRNGHGAPLYAVADGTITRTWADIEMCDDVLREYKNALEIRVADHQYASYLHLERGSAQDAIGIPLGTLPANVAVTAGQQVAAMGTGGCEWVAEENTHLHFGGRYRGNYPVAFSNFLRLKKPESWSDLPDDAKLQIALDPDNWELIVRDILHHGDLVKRP